MTIRPALTATDPTPARGVHQMHIKNDNSPWTPRQTYATPKAWRDVAEGRAPPRSSPSRSPYCWSPLLGLYTPFIRLRRRIAHSPCDRPDLQGEESPTFAASSSGGPPFPVVNLSGGFPLGPSTTFSTTYCLCRSSLRLHQG